MSNQATQEKILEASKHCPFLGIPGDATTHYRYPSRVNYCYAPNRPEPIRFEHQQAFCLTEEYAQCPVFRMEGVVSLPSDIRGQETDGTSWSRVGKGLLSLFGLAGIVAVLVFLILPLLGQNLAILPPSITPLAPSPTSEALIAHPLPTQSVTPSPELTSPPSTPTFTPTSTSSPTPSLPTSTPTVTATPTFFPSPAPGFGTPFATDPPLVIHIVQDGQSFTSIAAQYGTTPEVLAAVNILLEGQSLWVGLHIVVPVGVLDPTGLPRFQVFLNAENTTVEALAALFNTDPELIRRYNALGPQPEVPAARWLIIPLPVE
ncbi:MAG: hypothetical protein Fur0022_23560 [Anaerolineales bacterium]